MAAVWRIYGYQDYPASDPPVCAFKVHSGAQLKDFIYTLKDLKCVWSGLVRLVRPVCTY